MLILITDAWYKSGNLITNVIFWDIKLKFIFMENKYCITKVYILVLLEKIIKVKIIMYIYFVKTKYI